MRDRPPRLLCNAKSRTEKVDRISVAGFVNFGGWVSSRRKKEGFQFMGEERIGVDRVLGMCDIYNSRRGGRE